MRLGFFSLLAIVFITLKLTEVIAWSWWWVPAVIATFIIVFFVANSK